MKKRKARKGGKPRYSNYDDVQVKSPDGESALQWMYFGEPPHGDGIFQVSMEDFIFPHLYWGRNHAWSPCSQYFTLEQFSEDGNSLLVVRVSDLNSLSMGSYLTLEYLDYPKMVFKTFQGTKKIRNLENRKRWKKIEPASTEPYFPYWRRRPPGEQH